MRFFHRILTAIFCLIAAQVSAQEAPGVYIIYDSSNSMWGALPDSSRKYEAARAAMRDLAGRDFGAAEVALRMYGHRRKDDCSDSELVVPFSAPGDVAERMVEAMEGARPTGRTPIDLSLRQALADFGDRSGTIILISDGIESCDADPCALVRAWKNKDINIDVHVVGLGLKGKERAAMQCIAEAAGTPYRDAFSAGELIEGLGAAIEQASMGDKPEAGTPDPQPQDTEPSFGLVVEIGDGVRQRGVGTLTDAAGQVLEVETFNRYTPAPGDYQLTAGVQVVGGAAYQPVTVPISIATEGRTTGTVVAPVPPQVSASFAMEGEELRATVVRVYRDGKKLGSFKGDEVAFVPEGTLEFRSQLAGTSSDLIVTETFAAGDVKEIVFDAAIEVHLNVFAIASANGERLYAKPSVELWQAGERKHTLNSSSGRLVTPGTYRMVIDDRLNHFETEITVSREEKQEPQIEVPAGAVTIEYRDVGGAVEAPKRVFLTNLATNSRAPRTSGTQFALVPGRYAVQGWPKSSGYPETEIEVMAGEVRTVVLQATQ